MPTPEKSTFLPTAHDLYRKIIKKMSFTQDTNRNQVKKQISTKLDKHMSLLQSHKKRQLRFESNFQNLEKTTLQSMNHKRMQFQQKDKKVRESRGNFLTEKKKKMENSLSQWQSIVNENKRRHLDYLQKSSGEIKHWNSRCQDSLSKKKQRLNTISSNLNERSRISSAKTIKYQEQEYQKLLQRALINPQKQKSMKQKTSSRSKLMFNTNTDSRISLSSRTSSVLSSSRSKEVEQKRFQDYLQKLVNKEKHIKEVRNKKHQLISKFKQDKQNKDLQIGQMHRQNNRVLDTKREEMESKLDQKFMQDRKDKRNVNKSLPAINSKAAVSLIYGHRDQDRTYGKQTKKSQKDTLQPKFQKIIMDQLRNIALVSKNKLQY